MLPIILSAVLGIILGGVFVGIIKVGFGSDWSNREFDTTLLIFIGGFIAILVVVGCFLLHFLSEDNSLLSPEILMALIMMPSTIISYAMGKRSGEQTSMRQTSGDR